MEPPPRNPFATGAASLVTIANPLSESSPRCGHRCGLAFWCAHLQPASRHCRRAAVRGRIVRSTPPENSSEWAGSSPARDSHTGASLRPRWISMTRLAWATCSQGLRADVALGTCDRHTVVHAGPRGRAHRRRSAHRRGRTVASDVASSRGLPAGIVVVGGELDLGIPAPPRPRGRSPPCRVSLPWFATCRSSSTLACLPRRPGARSSQRAGHARAGASSIDTKARVCQRGSGTVHPAIPDRDRTLTDAEVQQAVETIVTLAADHGATLRGH